MPRISVKHICATCGYTTTRKCNYEKHHIRKNPCKPKRENDIQPTNSMIHSKLSNDTSMIHSTVCNDTSMIHSTVCNDTSMIHSTVCNDTSNIHENICHKCNVVFNSPRSLANHQPRCRGVSANTCEKCNKTFANAQSRLRHTRAEVCVAKNTQLDKTLSTLPAQTQAQIQTINNNVNNGTVNNYTINVNTFGNEDTSYVLNSRNPKKLVTRLLGGAKEGMVRLFALKHFHPDHPENHNIRKLDKKDKFIETFDGDEWTEHFYKDALDEPLESLRKETEKLLQQVIDNGGFEIHIKSKLDRFMDSIGESLGVDVTGDAYDRKYKMTQESKEDQKEVLRLMILKLIYKESLKHHRQRIAQ